MDTVTEFKSKEQLELERKSDEKLILNASINLATLVAAIDCLEELEDHYRGESIGIKIQTSNIIEMFIEEEEKVRHYLKEAEERLT